MGDSCQETTPLSNAFDGLLDDLELDDVGSSVNRRRLHYGGRYYEYELYVNPA